MQIKRVLAFALIFSIILALAGCGESRQSGATGAPSAASESASREKLAINVGGLKGPTGMALVQMKSTAEAGESTHNYNVTFDGAPDVIQGKLISGELDIAAVPTNLASVLYNKTEGAVRIIAVSRLNVLHIMAGPGVEVKSIDDLRGKTLFTAGQGSTQEYVLDYLLRAGGLDPATDLTVEYKSEHAEVVALLLQGQCDVALLPQPFVTTAVAQNDAVTRTIDVSAEWESLTGSELAMSCIVARDSFIEDNPEAIADFISDYAISASFPGEHVDEAAALIGEYEIIPEAVAKQAIPYSNIACVTGEEMRAAITAYLEILHQHNPASVGGALPDENLFYTA